MLCLHRKDERAAECYAWVVGCLVHRSQTFWCFCYASQSVNAASACRCAEVMIRIDDHCPIGDAVLDPCWQVLDVRGCVLVRTPWVLACRLSRSNGVVKCLARSHVLLGCHCRKKNDGRNDARYPMVHCHCQIWKVRSMGDRPGA